MLLDLGLPDAEGLDGLLAVRQSAPHLAAAEPLSDHVGTPGVLRAIGVLFLVIGADMLLARRLQGRRLAAATVALGAADLAFAAACTAALAPVETTPAGTALVLAVAAICVGMGVAKLLLARRLTG